MARLVHENLRNSHLASGWEVILWRALLRSQIHKWHIDQSYIFYFATLTIRIPSPFEFMIPQEQLLEF